MTAKIKSIFSIIYIVIVSIVLVSCVKSQIPYLENEKIPDKGLYGTILATGKSDAIVITIDSETIIIDTGERENGNNILKYLNECNIDNIKYLLITHFDKDHVGGAATVINNIQIENIIVPDYESESTSYLEFKSALKKKNITPKVLVEEFEFFLGDGKIALYPSSRKEYNKDSDDNKFSIVSMLSYGDKKLLLTGDAEKERIRGLIDLGIDVSCDLIKVPHHGNKAGDFSEILANKAKAKYGVITDSEQEKASDKVLEIYENVGTEIFETKDGSVSFSCGSETELIVTQNN